MPERPRLAELVGALSLATDLAAGLGYETALRVCVVATGLGRAIGLDGDALSDVYYTALLRFIGCTAFARADEETAAPRSKDVADVTALASEKGSAGLPIAVQVAARPWREDQVLGVMAALESNMA